MKALLVGFVGVVVVTFGFSVGATAGRAGADEVEIDDAYAGVYDCPGGDRIDEYQPRSRVFVVGQSENGIWVQVRNLDDPTNLVWMQTAALDIDDGDADLPVVSCETSGFASADVTTTSVGDTTTTTTAATTTTTTTTATTTTTTVATTTTAPDTTPPVVTGQVADPDEVYEYFPGLCTGLDRTSQISVTATDAGTGVATVEASWTMGGSTTTILLSRSGNTYTGTFPVEPDGVPYGIAPPNGEILIDIVITATDGAGNEKTVGLKVLVHSADKCLS